MSTMQNKVCLVTGATAGIGLVTARVLAQQGATTIVVSRNETKCAAVVNRLKQLTGSSNITYLAADLSSQQAIRDLVEQFKQNHRQLDVLVNNAGAIFLRRQESVDGIEMTLALNHLNYFLLTMLLLDTIKSSGPARIINVSSGAHFSGRINFEDLEGKTSYTGWPAYSQSKLANVLFTYELAKKLAGSEVTTNALHPGVVATNFGANNGWWGPLVRRIFNLVSISPEEGAETTIYLATSAEVEGVSGQYFEQKQTVRSSPASYDEATAQRLWDLSLQMTGLD